MLKKVFYVYLRSLLIFSAFVSATYIVLSYFTDGLVSEHTPFLILVFMAVTAVSRYLILKTDVERLEYKPDSELSKEMQIRELANIDRRIITRYMLTTTVKLLSFLALLGFYAYFNRGDKASIVLFSVNFLVLYFLYAAFEMVYARKPKG